MSYRITPTELFGCDSGRRRWHVYCVECGVVLHEATTGPLVRIRAHDRQVHHRYDKVGDVRVAD